MALLVTAALSVDQSAASYGAIRDIDPHATGALYICCEVLLSFAGHTDAVLSIPFEQTGRFVRKHDSLRAGLLMGEGWSMTAR